MIKMDDMHKFGVIFVPIVWVVGALCAVIIYLSCKEADKSIWTLSYVLGLITALMNFGLLMKSNRRLVENAKNNITHRNLPSFFVRTLVFVGVFAAIAFNQYQSVNPRFHLIPAFLGYMTLKAVLIIFVIARRGKVNK